MFSHAYHKALEKKLKEQEEKAMEEKILVLRDRVPTQTYFTLSTKEELDLWMKDGSIEDGDHILICKDYSLHKVESQTKLKLVKI